MLWRYQYKIFYINSIIKHDVFKMLMVTYSYGFYISYLSFFYTLILYRKIYYGQRVHFIAFLY